MKYTYTFSDLKQAAVDLEREAINLKTQRDMGLRVVRELLAMLDGQAPLNTKAAYDFINHVEG